jgi:hypothetical protein
MTTSSGERQPLPATRTALPSYPRPACPVSVERSALAWWLVIGCWFAGSAAGQLLHSPAAMVFRYRYTGVWALSAPLAMMLFGLVAVFLASLVLPLRDGARWARSLLTVFAVLLAGTLVWQVVRCLFAGAADPGGIAQGLLGLVALGVLPGAVGLMYRRDVRSHYRAHGVTSAS